MLGSSSLCGVRVQFALAWHSLAHPLMCGQELAAFEPEQLRLPYDVDDDDDDYDGYDDDDNGDGHDDFDDGAVDDGVDDCAVDDDDDDGNDMMTMLIMIMTMVMIMTCIS